MSEVQIISFDKQNQEHIRSLENLFKAYYDYFHSLNVQLKLVEGGQNMWVESVIQSVGRLSVLPLAIFENQIIGFAHGSIKLLPDYLGSQKTGVVQHVYVRPDWQRKGIAERLIKSLEIWFNEKQVVSIELQVVQANHSATEFWNKLGYQTELTQMRKWM